MKKACPFTIKDCTAYNCKDEYACNYDIYIVFKYYGLHHCYSIYSKTKIEKEIFKILSIEL